jgi:Holliday junction resolvase RusA-like endonuclease
MKITIHQEPIPKARPRVVTRNGRTMSFTPSKTVNAENDIRAKIIEYKDYYPAGVPLKVDLTFYVSPPAHLPKKRQYPCVKPDIDNYCKLVMDACNHYLWADDGQIVDLRAQKLYAFASNVPRIEIEIQEIIIGGK